MHLKVVILFFCTICFLEVNSGILKRSASDDDSKEEKKMLESFKQFVYLIDKYNMDVTVVGSDKTVNSEEKTKESQSVAIHMPVNTVKLTKGTFDNQSKYLKRMKKLAERENVGVRTRIVKVEDGKSRDAVVNDFNEKYIITSPSYRFQTYVRNGVKGFSVPENVSIETLYNYVIQDPKQDIQKVHVITAQVVVEEEDVSPDFPKDVLEETKKFLQKFTLTIDDLKLLSGLLSEHLDGKFKGSHQVVTDVGDFSTAGKPHALLTVANFNVLVILM